MPSTILFSNASFDEPAQATVLRSIESVKRKVVEDDTWKLYESCLNKHFKEIKNNEQLNSKKSILGSIDDSFEHKTINTIIESQTSKIDIKFDSKPTVKKRKIKIIPNKINDPKSEDSQKKTIELMTKVCVYYVSFPLFLKYSNIII